MVQLFLHSGLSSEQAKLSAMEPRAEQFVDRLLEVFVALENADRFRNGPTRLFN
jgi:hypothetical protein